MHANIQDAARLARQLENRYGLELIEAVRFLQEQSIKGETWINVNYVPVGISACIINTKTHLNRRHELNHNPEAVFRCTHNGCKKTFHRSDLLARHMERQ